MAAGRRSLDYSPDPLNKADALGWLGLAYLEQGDPAAAIDVLEQSVEHWSRFRVRSVQGGFRIFHLLSRGWGERLLALIAQRRGDSQEAQAFLQQARGTLTSISAGFEAARTCLLLAEVCAGLGDGSGAAAALVEARRGFADLKIPKYARWTETLAAGLGLSRPDASVQPQDRVPRWA